MRASCLISFIWQCVVQVSAGQTACYCGRNKLMCIANTFDSKSMWKRGHLPGSSQMRLLPPLAWKIKSLFSLHSLTFISLSHFHFHRLQFGCHEQIVTLCDMAVGQNYALPPMPCQYPDSWMAVRGLWKVPFDGSSLQVLEASLHLCPHSQVFNFDSPASNL